MSCYTAVVRRARKIHKCYGCRAIQPGEYYIVHTEFPGGDAGYADSAGHPVRMAECSDCATRYDRGHMIAEAQK